MTSFQPELWVDRAPAAVAFYGEAFGAFTLHQVGEGDDIVAQLAVGDARFWVASADASRRRSSPLAIGGRTSRTALRRSRNPDPCSPKGLRAGATKRPRPATNMAGELGGSWTPTAPSPRMEDRQAPRPTGRQHNSSHRKADQGQPLQSRSPIIGRSGWCLSNAAFHAITTDLALKS